MSFCYVTVTKFIRVGIAADKNATPVFFDRAIYEGEVDENEQLHHVVLTVAAKGEDPGKKILRLS